MSNELLEVIPGFLQQQAQDDRLLCPVGCLQQIVGLENPFMSPDRKLLEHGRGVEIPDRSTGHDVQTVDTRDRHIHGRIYLFHETRLLAARLDPESDGHWANHSLREKFTSEGKDDDVEGDERKVLCSFSIVYMSASRRIRVLGNQRVGVGQRVGEEDGAMERVSRCRIDHVGGEKNDKEDKRVDPGMLEGHGFPSPQVAAGFSSLGGA